MPHDVKKNGQYLVFPFPRYLCDYMLDACLYYWLRKETIWQTTFISQVFFWTRFSRVIAFYSTESTFLTVFKKCKQSDTKKFLTCIDIASILRRLSWNFAQRCSLTFSTMFIPDLRNSELYLMALPHKNMIKCHILRHSSYPSWQTRIFSWYKGCAATCSTTFIHGLLGSRHSIKSYWAESPVFCN